MLVVDYFWQRHKMAIAYSGTIVYSTFTCTSGTRREIVDGITGILASAGWSYVSGSGTGDVKMTPTAQSGITQSIWRFRDTGSGNCAVITLFNGAQSASQSGGCFLLPAAGKIFTVHANPYQFFVWSDFIAQSQSRNFVCGGQPKVPSFLAGTTLTEVAWLQGDVASDTDTQHRGSFRNSCTSQSPYSQNNQHTNMAAIYNATLWEISNQSIGFIHYPPGLIQLMTFSSGQLTTNTASSHPSAMMNRWYDGSVNLSEPIIGWSSAVPSTSNEAVSIGYIWDAVVYNDYAPLAKTYTFDSHNWVNMMDNPGYPGNNTGIMARCGLLLATT